MGGVQRSKLAGVERSDHVPEACCHSTHLRSEPAVFVIQLEQHLAPLVGFAAAADRLGPRLQRVSAVRDLGAQTKQPSSEGGGEGQ